MRLAYIGAAALMCVVGGARAENAWVLHESKSPVDDSPQIAAVLESDEKNGAIILRCTDQKTDAGVVSKGFIGLGDRWPVIYRIDSRPAVETSWFASTNGKSVFIPSPIKFIRALPTGGKLFVRIAGFDGVKTDLTFHLGDIDGVRQKVAATCHWPT